LPPAVPVAFRRPDPGRSGAAGDGAISPRPIGKPSPGRAAGWAGPRNRVPTAGPIRVAAPGGAAARFFPSPRPTGRGTV